MGRYRGIIRTLTETAAAMALAVCVAAMGGEYQQSVEAAGRPVEISSCLISGTDVVCEISADKVPASDDGKFYIYANEVFEDGGDGSIVAEADAETSISVGFPLNYNTEKSNLSRKFLVAVKRNGEMVQVSDEHYITNPEAIARVFTSPRMDKGIKGILPDMEGAIGGDLEELGVHQVIYNIYVDDICSDESVPGAIPFEYNGRTYYFDREWLKQYDDAVMTFNNLEMQVTMVLLNRGEGEYSRDLVHPLAEGGSSPGYALNVADLTGAEHLKAVGAFLGRHYSGADEYGQVDNWILGNEVNARTEWWYTSSESLDVNVSAYVKAFRIIYNEMKAMNANVRIYNSIDQEWNRKSNPGSFLAKDYLDKFNYYMNREGNIDWGLSYHPYNSPLYDPYAWNGPAVWVKKNIKTPYITMQNIDILIDYMHREEFLNPAGEVRSISLAEIGYTSDFGNSAQEASIAYAFLKAESLPDVDAFMLFRLTDNAHEMESHLDLGLKDLDGKRKPAFEIYKNLGTDNEAEAKARASEIIGMDIDEMISQNIVWTRSGDGVVQ